MNDEYSRIALSRTIFEFHGIHVDWRKHSWSELSDLYQRLNLTKNIKQRWNLDVDWKDKTPNQLSEIYQLGIKEIV